MSHGSLRTAVVLAAVCLVLAAATREASAQARVIIAPTAAAGPLYDDNLFSAPKGQEVVDVIWRVTPGLAASRETPRTIWYGSYSFDAELFRDHPALTTPLARQTGSGFVRVQPSTRSTFTLSGGYDNTITPSELNLTTGLQLARVRGWRWHAGPEFTHALGPSASLTLLYDMSDESLSTRDTLMTQAGDLRLASSVGEHHEIQITAFLRDFVFNTTTSVYSAGGMLGWAYKITPYTKLTIAAGPRLLQGDRTLQPEIDASLVRHARLTDVSLNYARTITAAVGLPTPLTTERIIGSASYRHIAMAEIGIQGGVYINRNDRADSTVRVYRIGADMMRRLAGAISISASYNIDFQRGRFRAARPVLATPAFDSTAFVPDPLLVLLPPVFIDSPLRHSTAMIRLTISPRFRPTSKPREGAPDDQR